MDRYVLVTGSAGGIGRATVEMLLAEGAHVVGVDVKDADICCDLALPEARRRLSAEIQSSLPRLDAVVATAGILEGKPSKVTSINFFGATQLLQELRPMLAVGDSPRAIVFSSISSRQPCDEAVIEACLNDNEAEACILSDASERSAYVTSKAALARWVRRHAIAPAWGGNGILLNAIAPGTIENTGMTTPMLEAPGGIEIMRKYVPSALAQFGTPADIAELVSFLSGARNGYITGQVIYADGGSDAIQRGDKCW